MSEIITQDGEIITGPAGDTSLAIGLTRAEIDQQIATAHAFPRSIARSQKAIFELVTIDEESAKECNYALPRGGKPITGPSIRLAEIIAGQYGNCRVGARVVHVDRAEKYVEAEGVFHDLESNTATTARVRRRIVDSKGKLYSDDMIIVTGNAACSIAKRNAILGAVPKAVWRKAYEAALATIKGDITTLSERRERVLKAFAAFGAKPEEIFAALSIGGIDDIGLDEIATLTGMHAALKNGEATVEEMFNRAGSGAGDDGQKKSLKDKLGDVAKGGEKPKEEAKAEQKGQEAKKDDKPADDDDFPGDRPSKQPAQDQRQEPDAGEIEAARDRGHEAYHKGMARRAVPQNVRAHPPLERAWLDGYDAAAEEADQEGGEA